MFLYQGTETPLPLLKTGLCREQYMLLQVELLKAKEHGVEFFFCFNINMLLFFVLSITHVVFHTTIFNFWYLF